MTGSAPPPVARPVTSGPAHHFFGYYDKSPWDASGRYMLALESLFMDRAPTPADAATIGVIDTAEGNRWRPVAQTRAWNWQQGNMLQWLPPACDRKIIYNARQAARFVSVIVDVVSGEEAVLARPIYAVSPRGDYALSLNFARIAHTRPGYGYLGVEDPWRRDPAPAEDGVYRMDLRGGEPELIVSLAAMAALRPLPSMCGAVHWFNHVQINTDGSRFAFLHRWRVPPEMRWQTRMVTADPDGSNVHILADDGMTSHYDWRDAAHVLAWARKDPVGDRYFLFTDRSDEAEVVGEGALTCDGHCSYSPDRRWILTDTYPDKKGVRTAILFRNSDVRRAEIGHFFSPPDLSGEIRCDLHPRWSRDGRMVCIDSAHEGSRQMYVLDVSGIVSG